jgi:hypothetical protein
LRRDRPSDKDGWTDLPAKGRAGDPPKWPLCGLEDGLPDRESVLWASIWVTPQAAAWERLGWTLEVALYVRLMVLAEAGDVKAAAELRQWSDRLGLNPAAMLRNRWRVAADQVAAKRAAVKANPDGSMRDRLKALNGGGA